MDGKSGCRAGTVQVLSFFWGEDERRFFKTEPTGLDVAHRIGGTVLYALETD
jgi:hypothetical protein